MTGRSWRKKTVEMTGNQKSCDRNGKRRQRLLCLFLLFLFMIPVCILVGAVGVSFADVVAVLCGRDAGTAGNIILYVRLPRVIACGLAGAGLAVSGAVIQNVLRNPLAGPNIIGVNAGGGFAVVLCSALFPYAYRAVPFAAFLGALGAVLFIYFLARRTGASKVTLVLAGVCVNSLLNAASDVIHTISENTLTGTYSFRLGGFSSLNSKILWPAGVLIVAAIVVVILLQNELEVLSLGENVASSVGLNVKLFRMIFLLLAAVLAGASVSFAGLLGFVGLIAPHIARRLVGEECRYLIPFSAMFGAFFVMLCDLAARTLVPPYEIPTGVVLSFLGSPFFLHLLLRQKRRKRHVRM